MSSSLRRGALAAAAIVVSVAPLSACAAGNDAQTLQVKPDNAATSVGEIKIQNATLVTQPDPKVKGPAAITATVFNNGARSETLKAITLPGTGLRAKLAPPKSARPGPIVVPAGGSVTFGGKGNASAVVSDGRKAARPGDAQPIVFDFSETGNVEITAFVFPAKSYFKGWGPAEVPRQTPSATPSGSATRSPHAGSRPGDKPSGSATASHQPGGAEQTTGAPAHGIASGEPTPNGH